MKQLIRFEDAYGMADIVCIAHDLGLIELQPNGNSGLNGVNKIHTSNKKDIYVECGISFPTILTVTNDLITKLVKNNISELILVYDMDSPKPGQSIISSKDLSLYLNNMKDELKRNNLGHIRIKLAPVVWAAETLAISIMACDYDCTEKSEKCIECTEIVHAKNTAKLHAQMLLEFLIQNSSNTNRKVKHIRDYIPRDEIIPNLEKLLQKFPKTINKQIIQWIVTLNINQLYNISDAINHQGQIEKLYLNSLPKQNEYIYVNSVKLDLNKKCW